MKRLQYNNEGYEIKRETIDGIETIIVPVVMMLEGVHNGSDGPVLHTAEELSKNPSIWDGYPVTVNHPQEGDKYISAFSEGVIHVGAIHNTRFENGKLKADLYINESRMMAINPTCLQAIVDKEPLDVSIGVFSENVIPAGMAKEDLVWNGEQYNAIATNYQPDHLALLPGDRGACSWQDGCGVRVNRDNQSNISKKGSHEMNEEMLKSLKVLNGAGLTVHLMTNETGLTERLEMIRQLVNSWDNDVSHYYLVEVFEDSFIYHTHIRNSNFADKMYRVNYSVNDKGVIETSGDPAEVRRKVEFVTMRTRTNITNNKKGGEEMSDNKKTPCFLAKVEKLTNHKLSNFTESDVAWLLEQSEETLDKLMPKEVQPAETPQMNAEQAMQVLKNSLQKPEDFISLLPAEMQDSMKNGLSLHKAHRKTLIEKISVNGAGVFSETELEAMQTEQLEKIAKVAAKHDYSVNEQNPLSVNADNEILMPTGVSVETKG